MKKTSVKTKTSWWLLAYRVPFFVVYCVAQAAAAIAILLAFGIDEATRYLSNHF